MKYILCTHILVSCKVVLKLTALSLSTWLSVLRSPNSVRNASVELNVDGLSDRVLSTMGQEETQADEDVAKRGSALSDKFVKPAAVKA